MARDRSLRHSASRPERTATAPSWCDYRDSPPIPNVGLLRGLLGTVEDLLWTGRRDHLLSKPLEQGLMQVRVDLESWCHGTAMEFVPRLARHVRWLIAWTERVDHALWYPRLGPRPHSLLEALRSVVQCAPNPEAESIHLVELAEPWIDASPDRVGLFLASALQSALWHGEGDDVLVNVSSDDLWGRLTVRDFGPRSVATSASDVLHPWTPSRTLDLMLLQQVAAEFLGAVRLYQDGTFVALEVEFPLCPPNVDLGGCL